MTSNAASRLWGRAWIGMLAASLLSATGCVQMPDFGAMWAKVPTPKNLASAEKQKFTLARLAERRGQPGEAEHIYEAIIAKNPKHQESHHRLAVLKSQKQKFAEADVHFHKAWELGPQTVELMSDMGYRLHLEHRLPEAEKILRDALAKEPQHVASTNNLALIVGQQGRLQEAYTLFKRVGSEAEAEANIAYLLAQRGDLRLAQTHYSKALSLKNDLKPAAAALLQIADRESMHVTGQPLLEPLQSPTRYAAPRSLTAPMDPAGNPLPADVASFGATQPTGPNGQVQQQAQLPPVLPTNPYNLPLPERTNSPLGMSPPGIPRYEQNNGQATLTNYSAPVPSPYVGQPAPQPGYQPAPGASVAPGGFGPPVSFGTQGQAADPYAQPNAGAARITGVQPTVR